MRATYRLQLTSDFGFAKARALVPYLSELGISHLYLSPCFQARSGSTHRYDVVDPNRISEELGDESEYRALSRAARESGIGIVQDVVPNHMAADAANRYWTDARERFFDIDRVTGRYRRFFDIDHLAGVRQEDPAVFEETHKLVLSLVRDGVVDGLRVDHPDGLADPAGYLERLPGHVWVEKILDPGERLRDWPVEGTVGYEFLNDVAALFVDAAAEGPLTDLWHDISGDVRPFGCWAREAKREQASTTFAPEVDRLARILGRDDGIVEAAAALPVYRTYVEPGKVADADRVVIDHLPEWLRPVFLNQDPAEFVTRFQQLTPAVMAKGVEDTAFYRYARLLALNDVGGDPGRFGISVERFHSANLERAERFPRNLLTTQTHDAKRSCDVRARIGAISLMPDAWCARVRRWFELNAHAGAPDPVEEYFIYQTLAGAWPIEAERIDAYVEKALREAKRNTNWIDPNEDHERRVSEFCRRLYEQPPFLADFEPFVARLAAAGDRAALAQVALKLTVPGVPDIYQGDELAFRALVDPDNRRPVDWGRRRAALADPPPKLRLIQRLLRFRARAPEVFEGGYEPLEAGSRTCAFMRGGRLLVVVAVRPDTAADTLAAPRGSYRDVLTDERRTLSERPRIRDVVGEDGFAILDGGVG